MKILVIGCYYSLNLGDGVICDCAAAMLRRHFPMAQVVIRDIGGHTAFPERSSVPRSQLFLRRGKQLLRIGATRMGWNRQLRHVLRNLEPVMPALERLGSEECDLVVFAGGQLWMDSLALYVQTLVDRFAARKIPVFFNACGTGPSWSREVRQRLAQALNCPAVRYVSCRDNTALVNTWCGRDAAVPAADPALWADQVYGIPKDPGAAAVGLGIMWAGSMPLAASFAFWRRLIRRMEREHIPWKLFTNGSEWDMAFAQLVLRSLPELKGPEEAYLCPAPKSPEELVGLIAGFRSLISFRLHSHIIACSLDIPTVGLVWDDKLRFFFEKIGRPERCLSVHATPGQVLRALKQAEQIRCDREAICAQREASARQLLDALEPYIQ